MKGMKVMTQKINIYYAVLQYIPSQIRHECLNVGIAFHVPNYKMSKFVSARNKQRIARFDDEWDKSFFDITMEALHEDLDFPTTGKLTKQAINVFFPKDDLLQKNSFDYLRRKTEYFANEFQFRDVECIVSDERNLKTDMENLEKTFLYYDRPKSKRITTPAAKRLLKKSLKSKNTDKELTEPQIKGKFDTKSIIDYKLGENYLKVTSFDYAENGVRAKELKSSLFDIRTAVKDDKIKNLKIIVSEDISKKDKYESKENQEVFDDFNNEIKQLNTEYNSNIKIVSLQEML